MGLELPVREPPMIAATPTTYEHIALDDQGIPWIRAAVAGGTQVGTVLGVSGASWTPLFPIIGCPRNRGNITLVRNRRSPRHKRG